MLGLSQTFARSLPGTDLVPSETATATPSPTPDNFIKDLVHDQKKIFASPLHLERQDLKWIIPFAVATGFLLKSDRETSSWVSPKGTLASVSEKVSWGGEVFVTSGFAAGLFALGRSRNDSHLAKTGKLAFEALVGTSLVIGITKNVAERTRPNGDNGLGHFFQEGKSFPSGHSSDAWAVATVIAYEYRRRPVVKYGAVAAAIAISLSRYSCRAHFMSEVLVGSAIGYGVARFVYVSHN